MQLAAVVTLKLNDGFLLAATELCNGVKSVTFMDVVAAVVMFTYNVLFEAPQPKLLEFVA